MMLNAFRFSVTFASLLLFSACGRIAEFHEQYENYRTGIEGTESADQVPVTAVDMGALPASESMPVGEVPSEDQEAPRDALVESESQDEPKEQPVESGDRPQLSREVCEQLRSERSNALHTAQLIGNGRRISDQLIEVAINKILLIEIEGNDNDIGVNVQSKSGNNSDEQGLLRGACIFVKGNASRLRVRLASQLQSLHVSVVGNGSSVGLRPEESDLIGPISRYIKGNKSSIQIESEVASN